MAYYPLTTAIEAFHKAPVRALSLHTDAPERYFCQSALCDMNRMNFVKSVAEVVGLPRFMKR